VVELDDNPGPAATPRLIDRLRAAGLSEERIEQLFQTGAVRHDGEQVTDLDQLRREPRGR
jgi:hypothetical protein